MQGASTVGEYEGGEDVERRLFGHARQRGEYDLLRMALDDFQYRRALEPALGEKLGKHRRLENAKPDIETDADEQETQQEGHTPAPCKELLARHLAESEDGEIGQQ